MRNLVRIAALLGAIAAVPASAQDASPAECGFAQDAPIFGVGMAAGSDATPLLAPIEQGIVQRGDKSASLRSIKVPATRVEGWTTDYAIMRLSQVAGKPIWAVTETGKPGDAVTLDIPDTTLGDAFDRIVAAKGMRWRYDGEKVYVLGGREWTIPMPENRDVALAVRHAIESSGLGARIDGRVIRFHADDDGAAKVSAIVGQVYAQSRLNPYDVQFYRVFPTRGAVDWSALAMRTDAVETVAFDGKGATVVLDPTAGAVVDTFLAREGAVRSLGATTMVSPVTGAASAHVAGCGVQADPGRGLELTGGAFDKGRISMRYAIVGGTERQVGSLSVVPGSVVVLADGEPKEGAYMVAVVRPRVIELQNAGAPARLAQVAAPAPVPVAPLRRVEVLSTPAPVPAVRLVEVPQKPYRPMVADRQAVVEEKVDGVPVSSPVTAATVTDKGSIQLDIPESAKRRPR